MAEIVTRGVFFDLDGTIANTIPLIYKTYERVFNKYPELGGSADRAISMLGMPLRDILKNVVGAARVEFLVTEYLNIYKELHDEFLRPYSGINEVLEALKNEGFYLGVVTSKARETTDLAIAKLGFLGLFNLIITAEDSSNHKPSPEPILTAFDKSGISSVNAVYVGDSPYDVLSAKGAGVKVVAVTWGAFKKSDLIIENPDVCISSPDQLKESIISLFEA